MSRGRPEGRTTFKPADEITPSEALPDLAALVTDIVVLIQRFIVLSDFQAVALALWVIHTHALDAFDTTPYIAINSAVKRCGKTILLEVLSLLVARPWLTGRATPAVLVRKLNAQRSTLLLDESDSAFQGPKEYAEALRSTLNSGYRRGMHVSLCVQGKDWEPRDFDVFGAKAIAGIGRLPDTVADRSIAIVLRRRAPGELVARYRHRRAAEEAEPIFNRAVTWAAERTTDLQDAEPQVPNELDDRAAEGWEPLLAIADLAGGAWPAKAREAAVALSAGEGREDESLGIRLLTDIKAVFDRGEADNLSSADLVQCLNAMEEAPWGDIRGHALDPRRLAWRLKPFAIKPKQVRIGSLTLKGYSREDFADDWSRYIPSGSETRETSETDESTKSASAGVDVSDVSDVSANGVCGEREACVCGSEYTAYTPSMRPVCERHRTPEEPCYACGSCLFWARQDGGWLCARCVLRPAGDAVLEEVEVSATGVL